MRINQETPATSRKQNARNTIVLNGNSGGAQKLWVEVSLILQEWSVKSREYLVRRAAMGKKRNKARKISRINCCLWDRRE